MPAMSKESRVFTPDPRCLLKISEAVSPRALTLADGTRLRAGERVVGAHLWNEHLPSRAEMGLATQLTRMRTSLRALAHEVEARPDLHGSRAVYGEIGFVPEARLREAQRAASRLGFELHVGEQPRWNPLRRAFWQNAVSWWFLRRFNPARLDQVGFGQMRRCEVWMSREQLLARYGAELATP